MKSMSRSKGEVLSLQVGNCSNFTCSHLWNSRDSLMRAGALDPSVYYHEARCSDGMKRAMDDERDTRGLNMFFPRCVAVDLNERMEHLTVDGAGAETLETMVSNSIRSIGSIWGGAVETGFRTPAGQTAVHTRDIESDDAIAQIGTSYWTQSLKAQLHSKSMSPLPTWTTTRNFEVYHRGRIGSAINEHITVEYLDALLDRCRYFAEACDRLTCIDVFCDLRGGFAGLTASLLSELAEEYGASVALPVWIADNYRPEHSNAEELLQYALLIDSIAEQSSLQIPFSQHQILNELYAVSPTLIGDMGIANDLEREQFENYLSTAIAAAAIDAATSYRCDGELCGSAYSTPSSLPDGMMDTRMRHDHGDSNSSSSSSCNHTQASIINRSEGPPARSSDRSDSTLFWCSKISNQGRFPMASLEVGIPGLISPYTSVAMGKSNADDETAVAQQLYDSVVGSFTAATNARCNKQAANPFTVSLSPQVQQHTSAANHRQQKKLHSAHYDHDDAADAEDCQRGEDGSEHVSLRGGESIPYQRAYTNHVSIRSPRFKEGTILISFHSNSSFTMPQFNCSATAKKIQKRIDFAASIFSKCFKFPYSINECNVDPVLVYVGMNK